VALVDYLRETVEPAVDGALLRHGAPVPLRVGLDVQGAPASERGEGEGPAGLSVTVAPVPARP
jgi:hypothetical protein